MRIAGDSMCLFLWVPGRPAGKDSLCWAVLSFIRRVQTMRESFYELLREYRGRSGLSFDTLSDLVITSPGYLYRLFQGRHKPSRDFLIRLALALGLSVEDADYLLREAGFYGLLEKNPILASYPASNAGAPPARAEHRS